jgi:mRNA-degrading endonuclease RelE of RelBE toxin-antitoxin system
VIFIASNESIAYTAISEVIEKSFPTEKHTFFLFQVFDLRVIFVKTFARMKIVCENFCENKICLGKLSQKQKFLRKRKFLRNKISQKYANFRLIFTFRENEKTVFVSTLFGT